MSGTPRRRVGVFRTQVEWIDTDAAGIYHNSTVVRFVEAAEARLMAGHGLHDYFAAAPRVRYEVDFAAPLFFGQRVTATVELVHVGTTSMTFDFEVWGEAFQGRPRTCAARGRYVTVHIDRAHREGARGTPWPADWVGRLASPSPR